MTQEEEIRDLIEMFDRVSTVNIPISGYGILAFTRQTEGVHSFVRCGDCDWKGCVDEVISHARTHLRPMVRAHSKVA